jgi:hypothetical protein
MLMPGERHVQSDEIGKGKEFFQARLSDAHLRVPSSLSEGIICDDFHLTRAV